MCLQCVFSVCVCAGLQQDSCKGPNAPTSLSPPQGPPGDGRPRPVTPSHPRDAQPRRGRTIAPTGDPTPNAKSPPVSARLGLGSAMLHPPKYKVTGVQPVIRAPHPPPPPPIAERFPGGGPQPPGPGPRGPEGRRLGAPQPRGPRTAPLLVKGDGDHGACVQQKDLETAETRMHLCLSN